MSSVWKRAIVVLLHPMSEGYTFHLLFRLYVHITVKCTCATKYKITSFLITTAFIQYSESHHTQRAVYTINTALQ